MNKIELLAPVGDMDSFYAAINNGANAIYLGGKQFSARAFATNFSNEEIKWMIQYAHQNEVLVYIAVNTLIFEDELPSFIEYLDFLYCNDADAFIIQDMGLLDMVLHRYPKIKIHVSTQQNINSVLQAQFLKQMGVQRIILARETPLSVVKEIVQQVGIEVEIFVFGSLCVSYSGTCLHSSIIGKRSGNRGKCAQPCRMEYTLFEDKKPKSEKKYLLSMKDLNTLDSVYDLIESGVKSFKIEGRMKSALYVGAVTKAFADSINYALKHKKTLNQKDTSILLQNLFTRSFTKGYLLNESNDQLTSTFRPNHIGQKIGKVIASYAHKIKIQLTKPVSQKDKIVILQKEDVSFYLSKMKVKDHYVKKAYPNEIIELEVHSFIQNQADVYQCLENKKVEAIELQNQQTKKIPIQLFFLAQYNQPMKLIIKDNLHHTLTIESTYLPLKSQTDFLTEEKIKEQLTKFKNTIYECQHFECQIEKQLYIPIKELNQIRREAIEKLNLCRANFNHRDLQDIKIEKDSMDWMNRKIDKSLKIAVKVKNLSQLEALLPYKIDYVYYDDRKTFNQAKKILPQIIYCTNRIDVSIPAEKKQVLIHQLSCLKAYSKQTWLSDIYCNVTNSLTVDFCLKNGIQHIGLSPELSKNKLKELLSAVKEKYHQLPQFEFLVYGRLQNMVMKHCLIAKNFGMKEKHCGLCKSHQYAIVDRMNYVFPILCDEQCNLTIYNSKVVHLIDEIDDLYDMGVDTLRLDFSVESQQEVQKVLELYFAKMHHQQENFALKDATYGHFYSDEL